MIRMGRSVCPMSYRSQPTGRYGQQHFRWRSGCDRQLFHRRAAVDKIVDETCATVIPPATRRRDQYRNCTLPARQIDVHGEIGFIGGEGLGVEPHVTIDIVVLELTNR